MVRNFLGTKFLRISSKKHCKNRKFQGVIDFTYKQAQRILGEPTVYSAIMAIVLIIMQNVVLTADRVEFLSRLNFCTA